MVIPGVILGGTPILMSKINMAYIVIAGFLSIGTVSTSTKRITEGMIPPQYISKASFWAYSFINKHKLLIVFTDIFSTKAICSLLSTVIWSPGDAIFYPALIRFVLENFNQSEAGYAVGIKNLLWRLPLFAALIQNKNIYVFLLLFGSFPVIGIILSTNKYNKRVVE